MYKIGIQSEEKCVILIKNTCKSQGNFKSNRNVPFDATFPKFYAPKYEILTSLSQLIGSRDLVT